MTAWQDGNTIAWYENKGGTTFTRHIIDTQSPKAKRAEVADMNGDGDLDIVTASFGGQVAWHENNGNEQFTKHVIDAKARGAYYVSPADVDRDGDMDLYAAIRRMSAIVWYRNDGGGKFSYHVIDSKAHGARTVLIPIVLLIFPAIA